MSVVTEEGRLESENADDDNADEDSDESSFIPASLAFCLSLPIPMVFCETSIFSIALRWTENDAHRTPVHERATSMRCADCQERGWPVLCRLNMADKMTAIQASH